MVLSPRREPSAQSIDRLLDEHGVDLIALAGYLQLVPSDVVSRFEGRIVNVHPALLPAFGGHGHVRTTRAPRRDRVGREGQRRDRALRRRAVRPRRDHRAVAGAGVRERRRRNARRARAARRAHSLSARGRRRRRRAHLRSRSRPTTSIVGRYDARRSRSFRTRIPDLPRTSSSRWLAEAVGALFAVAAGAPSVRAQDTLATAPYSRAVSTWIALIATPGYERLADRPDSERDERVDARRHRQSHQARGQRIAHARRRLRHRRDGVRRQRGHGRRLPARARHRQRQASRAVGSVPRGTARSSSSPSIAQIRCGRTTCRACSPCGAITSGAGARPTTRRRRSRTCGSTSALARAPRSRTMGIDVLDPVVRDWPEWTFSDFVAGPAAANRAGCAAVVAAATQDAEQRRDRVHHLGAEVVLVGRTHVGDRAASGESTRCSSSTESWRRDAVDAARAARAVAAARRLNVGTTMSIGVPSRFAGTLAETVQRDATSRRCSRGGARAAPSERTRRDRSRCDTAGRAARRSWCRTRCRVTPKCSASSPTCTRCRAEEPMRDAIQSMLPAWARGLGARRLGRQSRPGDGTGPRHDGHRRAHGRDRLRRHAHRARRDALAPAARHILSLPVGRTAGAAASRRRQIASRDGQLGCGASRGGPLRGVFVPRDSSAQREPATLTAWFGARLRGARRRGRARRTRRSRASSARRASATCESPRDRSTTAPA